MALSAVPTDLALAIMTSRIASAGGQTLACTIRSVLENSLDCYCCGGVFRINACGSQMSTQQPEQR
jgi:hypothetical protein